VALSSGAASVLQGEVTRSQLVPEEKLFEWEMWGFFAGGGELRATCTGNQSKRMGEK
jgi:hypothetical protein